MDTLHLVYEVAPQSDNPVIGHVSKAVAHTWILALDMNEARHGSLRFLESEHWTVAQEIKAYKPRSLTRTSCKIFIEFQNYLYQEVATSNWQAQKGYSSEHWPENTSARENPPA